MKCFQRAAAFVCSLLLIALSACVADYRPDESGPPADVLSLESGGGACGGTTSACVGADGLTGKCDADGVCCTGCIDIDGTCFPPVNGCGQSGNACTTACHPYCGSFFDCPGVTCNYPACGRIGQCYYNPAPAGSPCGTAGHVCDGAGHCY